MARQSKYPIRLKQIDQSAFIDFINTTLESGLESGIAAMSGEIISIIDSGLAAAEVELSQSLQISFSGTSGELHNFLVSSFTGATGYYYEQIQEFFNSTQITGNYYAYLRQTGIDLTNSIDAISTRLRNSGVSLLAEISGSGAYLYSLATGFPTGAATHQEVSDTGDYILQRLSGSGHDLHAEITGLSGQVSQMGKVGLNLLIGEYNFPTGQESYFVEFDTPFSSKPKLFSSVEKNITGEYIPLHDISGVSSSGFHVFFDDVVTESGITISYMATTGNGMFLL